jgi:hypothetical protein
VSHVPPHRWADAWAGRLADPDVRAMERHAERCAACARARDRVTRASDSFSTLRGRSSPELAWDAVRARVHWTVSTERRAKQPRSVIGRRRAVVGWACAGVVAAGVVAALVVERPRETAPALADQPFLPRITTPATAAPTPLLGAINRTTGEVMLDGIRPDHRELFTRRLGAGTVIATATGEVDIQFGAASGLRLGPHSTLELRRFDARVVELVVRGRLDLQVGARAADQRFVVRAGDREIEVRGTQFRVEHTSDGATRVACRHGLVAVRDAHGQIEVAANRRVEVTRDRGVADHASTALTADEVAQLADATPVTLPVWDAGTLASSAPLEIATTGRREVRVDGIELGSAPMQVRVLPGRHTVEAADSRGRYRRVGWVDVAPDRTPARLEVLPEPSPSRGIAERRRQLRAAIDRTRLAHCMRRITKQGLGDGSYVQIELGVDAEGAINFLNVLDHDLPRPTAQCIQTVLVETVRFKPGVAAEWRERIDL